eukprot:6178219-Pleurochrysis_carterae.AAC.4
MDFIRVMYCQTWERARRQNAVDVCPRKKGLQRVGWDIKNDPRPRDGSDESSYTRPRNMWV